MSTSKDISGHKMCPLGVKLIGNSIFLPVIALLIILFRFPNRFRCFEWEHVDIFQREDIFLYTFGVTSKYQNSTCQGL